MTTETGQEYAGPVAPQVIPPSTLLKSPPHPSTPFTPAYRLLGVCGSTASVTTLSPPSKSNWSPAPAAAHVFPLSLLLKRPRLPSYPKPYPKQQRAAYNVSGL